MNFIEALNLALDALEYAPKPLYAPKRDKHKEAITALSQAIAEMEQVEPVAWIPSAEWTPCVKLPVTVHVRKQRDGETHVSTREGITGDGRYRPPNSSVSTDAGRATAMQAHEEMKG